MCDMEQLQSLQRLRGGPLRSHANSVVHVECEAEIVYLLFGKARVRAMKKLQSVDVCKR